MKNLVKRAAIAAVVVLAAGATLAEGSSSGDGDTIVDPTGSSSETTDEGQNGSSDLGTRDNPAPIGSIARVGDWEISVVEVTKDADKIVADENEFNDPPPAGSQYVLWTVEATYVGEESADIWFDTSWKIVGSDGNTFDESCGVIPDDLVDAGESFPGAKVSGNECVAVESSQLSGATILVEASFSIDDDRTFFAIP